MLLAKMRLDMGIASVMSLPLLHLSTCTCSFWVSATVSLVMSTWWQGCIEGQGRRGA